MPLSTAGRNPLRDHAAHDLVDELVALVRLHRLDLDVAVAELAAAAGLLLVASMGAGRLADRLAVGHARRLQVDLDPEPPVHALQHRLHVHLGEPAHDHLAGLLVAVHVQRRVLLLQAPQRGVHLVLVALAAGLDRERHHRRRQRDRLHGGRLVDIGQHVAGVGLLQLRDRADHAGTELIRGRVILALQHQQLADPLLAVRAAVDQLRVALERAGVDPHQVDAAAVGVGDRLEDVGERAGAAGLGHVAGACRRGQALHDQVEQPVRADVAGGGATADREHLALGDQLLQRHRHLLAGDLAAVQVALHQLVGGLGDDVHQLVVVLVCQRLQVLGDRTDSSWPEASSPCR